MALAEANNSAGPEEKVKGRTMTQESFQDGEVEVNHDNTVRSLETFYFQERVSGRKSIFSMVNFHQSLQSRLLSSKAIYMVFHKHKKRISLLKLFYNPVHFVPFLQHSKRLRFCWQCPLLHWLMRLPKPVAQAEWSGAHVTNPPASSIGRHGSGGSAATIWNTAPSFSKSSSARRRSAKTWGLRSMRKTSMLEFGWVWRPE